MKNALFRAKSRDHRFGIEGRFLLSFGAIVVCLMTTVISLVEHWQSSTLVEQTQQRGVAIAQSIAAMVKNSLLSYDFVSLQQAAETAAHDDVLYVIILTKENVVAGYSGRAELQGVELSDPVSRNSRRVRELLIQSFAKGDNGIDAAHLDIAVPVYVRGTPQRWGTVRVGFSLQSLHEIGAEMRRALLLLGAAAVVLVLLAASFLARRVTQPLDKLARATAAVARGDLDQEVDENPVGELSDLSRGFNQMIRDLKKSQDAVRYQNQQLENIVEARTAALHEKATQLEQAYERLMEVDRLKDDFLSNVSHELRTPLTSIRSFVELLLDPEEEFSEEERREFMGIISEQAQRLTRLISDLLDLSKMESGNFSCVLKRVDARSIIQPCIDTLRPLADERGLELKVSLPPELPDVVADDDRLAQVLTNLVGNAMKFTPKGGSITVSAQISRTRHRFLGPLEEAENWTPEFIGMQSEDDEAELYVLIVVRDTGVGIPIEDQALIFEKFGQVGNVLTEKPQGSGLGLPISGGIVLQHQGAIWVESAPDRGSAFGVTIPAASVIASGTAAPKDVAPRDTADDPEAQLVAALAHVTSGTRLLVVDDDPSIIAKTSAFLRPRGYEVIGCDSGSEAVTRARTWKPDAIVLDLMMPGIDGYDVLQLLSGKKETASIPVVVVSILEDREMALELGAAAFVRKPIGDKSQVAEHRRRRLSPAGSHDRG